MRGEFSIETKNFKIEKHNCILNSSKTILALILSGKYKITHLVVGNNGSNKLNNENTYSLGNKTYQFPLSNITVNDDENGVNIDFDGINNSGYVINEFSLGLEYNNEIILLNYGFLDSSSQINRDEKFKLIWKIKF